MGELEERINVLVRERLQQTPLGSAGWSDRVEGVTSRFPNMDEATQQLWLFALAWLHGLQDGIVSLAREIENIRATIDNKGQN
jgi:hypothetical protein